MIVLSFMLCVALQVLKAQEDTYVFSIDKGMHDMAKARNLDYRADIVSERQVPVVELEAALGTQHNNRAAAIYPELIAHFICCFSE